MTRSLLIELGCEELPANACRVAEREAGSTIEKLLAATKAVRNTISERCDILRTEHDFSRNVPNSHTASRRHQIPKG